MAIYIYRHLTENLDIHKVHVHLQHVSMTTEYGQTRLAASCLLLSMDRLLDNLTGYSDD